MLLATEVDKVSTKAAPIRHSSIRGCFAQICPKFGRAGQICSSPAQLRATLFVLSRSGPAQEIASTLINLVRRSGGRCGLDYLRIVFEYFVVASAAFSQGRFMVEETSPDAMHVHVLMCIVMHPASTLVC